MKKSVLLVFSFILSSQAVFAAQLPDPKNLKCVVQEIEMFNTKVEEVLSEKVFEPALNANSSGEDSARLFLRGNIEILVTLSFLKYTPLVSTYVKVGNVVVATDLKASVTDPKSGNQIVATCSYDQEEVE